MTDRAQMDERLARIARDTEGVRAGGGFAAAVMARLDVDDAGTLGASVWRTGRWALGAFAAAALLCVFWSFEASASADRDVMATVDPTELEP